MRLLLFLILDLVFGQDADEPDFDGFIENFFGGIPLVNITDEIVFEFCKEFHDGEENIEIKFLGQGAQARVYRCTNLATNPVNNSAVKFYRYPITMNVPEREIIDTAMGNLGIGAKVYEFNYNISDLTCNFAFGEVCGHQPAAKFEEFLSGSNPEYTDLLNPDFNLVVARKMAELHLVSPSEVAIPIDNYQKNVWPWNTARVVDHLNEIIYDSAKENIDVVIRANPITGKYGSIENLDDAAQFCQDLVDATNSPIVFSHNDPHVGNLFLRDGNSSLNDRFIFIDFDNAAFGYRAWDILYYLTKFPEFPSDDQLELFLTEYLMAYNKGSETKYTLDEILNEIDCHIPFHLLQTILFYSSFGLQASESIVTKLDDTVQAFLDGTKTCGDSKFPTENSAKLPTATLSCFVLLLFRQILF